MLKKIKTVIAGFRTEGAPAYATAGTYLGEDVRTPGMPHYRVASTFVDITDPNRRIVVPMTPREARAYAAWLEAEAAYVDHLNEGLVDNREPRVKKPDE